MTSLSELVNIRSDCQSGETRQRRRCAHLSQAELARALGVSPSTIARWEAGTRVPRADLALRYAKLLASIERCPA